MELSPGEPLSPYGASVTDALLEEGVRFGRFEIGERLTTTLLGALYRVRLRPAGGPRLMQVLPRALTRDPQLRQRLEERVETLGRVDSEVVLVPEAVEEIDGNVVLVYPDPGDLPLPAHREEGFLAKASAVRTFAKQLLLACDTVAAVGVHHFALTPDFILVTRSGTPRVWGFGVMEVLDRRQFEIFISSAIVPLRRSAEDASYTVIEALSPEWRNDDAVDVRADLFGLGVLLFNLLTGHPLPDEATRPSELDPDLAPGWDHLVPRLLETEPSLRYQTVEAVSTDLDRLERLDPAGGTRDDGTGGALGRLHLPQSWQQRMSRRARTLVQVSGLAVMLVILGLAGTSVFDFLSGAATGDTPPLQRVSAGSEELRLTLRHAPERVLVTLADDPAIRFMSASGTLHLGGERGTYQLRIESPGYRSAEVQVSLQAAAAEAVVELEPATASLRLRAPAGARLDVRQGDGATGFLGTVPESGVLEIAGRLLARDYDFTVSHPRYEPMTFEDFPLETDEWVEFNALLQPRMVPVEVVSSPPGVAVRVGGEEVGRTPLVLKSVPLSEALAIEVDDPAWKSLRKRFELPEEGPWLADLGSLSPTVSELVPLVEAGGRPLSDDERGELTVTLGDRAFSGDGTRRISHPAGSWDVRIEHPDFFPKAGQVELQDGQSMTLEVDLRPRPAVLEVAALPDRPVQALVDGQRRTLDRGLLQVPAGRPVEVVLEAVDHLPVRRVVDLRANGRERWNPVWKPLPGPERGEGWVVPRLGLAFAWVPEGTFQMGSPLPEPMRRPNEGPVTTVRLSQGFWIGATEVTQAAFIALMERNPSHFRGPSQPVESVTWDEAREFCERLTAREAAAGRLPSGFRYRLPTEAEWEYSARAGTRTAFHFGDRAGGEEEHFQGRYPRDYAAADEVETVAGTLPVGRFPANPWGLHDVHGNVREWTLDAYNDRLPGGQETDFRRRGIGRGNPVRGGSWSDLADRCRSAARETVSPEVRRPFIGFRVVLAADR